MKPLIINFAPTGVVPTKSMTPFVPVTADEIVSDALLAAELGASIVHLHARHPDGTPAYRRDIYAETISKIRDRRPDLILCVSTSGRSFSAWAERADALYLEGDLRPDMASLTLSSLNFAQSASVNAPSTVMKLAETMLERGIKPELEVFDVGMMNVAHYLIKKQLLQPPYYFNILLGNIASAQAKIAHLALLLSELPDRSCCALAGIGDCQHAMVSLGVILADGVRVGLEDNIWLDRPRRVLARNEELVRRTVRLADAYGRDIAAPADVRERLRIDRGRAG